MKVEVKLYNELKRYAPGDQNVFKLTLTPGTTVGDVLDTLNIPSTLHRVILLDGRRAVEETQLEPQSTLVLFSPVSGG